MATVLLVSAAVLTKSFGGSDAQLRVLLIPSSAPFKLQKHALITLQNGNFMHYMETNVTTEHRSALERCCPECSLSPSPAVVRRSRLNK